MSSQVSLTRVVVPIPPWPPGVEHLRRESFPDWYLASDAYVQPGYAHVVEARRSHLIGYAQCTLRPARHDLAHLHELVVEEKSRGTGIGRQILTELARWLGEIGIQRLSTTALADNEFASRDATLAGLGFDRYRDYDRVIAVARLA